MNCRGCIPWRREASALLGKLRASAGLMVGQPDYETYLHHRETRHPNETAMSREAFFREREARRYGEGGGARAFRCC